jgi:hypothetical protein
MRRYSAGLLVAALLTIVMTACADRVTEPLPEAAMSVAGKVEVTRGRFDPLPSYAEQVRKANRAVAEGKATRAEADALLKVWREDLFGRGAR